MVLDHAGPATPLAGSGTRPAGVAASPECSGWLLSKLRGRRSEPVDLGPNETSREGGCDVSQHGC